MKIRVRYGEAAENAEKPEERKDYSMAKALASSVKDICLMVVLVVLIVVSFVGCNPEIATKITREYAKASAAACDQENK